jgi:hypothetical protein
MRWRKGLTGLSIIATVPVSHGRLNPMILRQVRAFPFVFSPSNTAAGPCRGYRASGFVLTSPPGVQFAQIILWKSARGLRGAQRGFTYAKPMDSRHGAGKTDPRKGSQK